MDIAAWLRGLGLAQYASAFRDNDVDGEVLPELTADDLIGLGVTSIGHRRKPLAAIAALRTEPPTVAQSATSTTSASTSPPPIDAERRQLTVMFCDLVGSTALSTRFDPEDLRELIGAYHRAVADTVGRFDGFVAKYMGDGVLIYFGYPQAHEDDAERAVRAGLAVIEAVGRLAARQDLRVRLGIATGLAVVGDLLGEGAAQERGVVGETPNLAARLQALAAPNTLVIGEATRRQVGGLFELAGLGPQALAGFAEPQSSHAMLYGGHDPGVCARSIGGFTNWLIGYPDQALASAADALTLAERLGHPFTLGTTLLQATVFHQLRREPGMALQRAHAAEIVATEQRLGLHIDFRVLRGGALATQGAFAEAVAMIREGLSERNRPGANLYRPFCLAVFAEALEGAGEHDSALAVLSEALALVQKTGERWWEAEIHRLRGVSLLSQNCLTESETSFQRSIRIAQAQQAKSLELRAVRDLARLWGEQGRHAEARDLLAPAYGWFDEGFDTADLKQAKALLDELT